MRELKFRAWSLGNKMKGIETHYIEDFAIDAFYGTPKDIFDGNRSEDGIECIEQYTGLKDKNGKEIYEGDIVEQFVCGVIKFKGKEAGRKTVWQVRWNEEECCFELHYVRGSLFGDSLMSADDDYEIIGNIHENPELLGSEK